ncbi:HK97-gp10 family putative phage morphogenesis protein [Phenylobacterium sp.]|uniref:HK97-gp10 family putative phage morphogenesis protein n=1 Tax=Phenylobacterium sp. TaxID=1871053 RepID=UPI00301C522B
MEFSVKIEGLEKLDMAARHVQQNVQAELKKALYVSAQKVDAEAKKSIVSGQKSGRIYRRRSVLHQASAPGQAPASDTGRLVNSITSGLNPGKLESFVVAGRGLVKYARMLEHGTIKMAARPFMFPALEKSKAWIAERLQRAVRAAIAKGGQ